MHENDQKIGYPIHAVSSHEWGIRATREPLFGRPTHDLNLRTAVPCGRGDKAIHRPNCSIYDAILSFRLWPHLRECYNVACKTYLVNHPIKPASRTVARFWAR